MKLVRVLIRLFIAGLLSGWTLLLWQGIDTWQTGVQQQIDGSRSGNSFPYESFGRTCVQYALIWGFVACASFAIWCSSSLKPSNSPELTRE